MTFTLIGFGLVLCCLHVNAQIGADEAIVFLTSSSHTGDLSSNPCQTAVQSSIILTNYTSGYSIFPLVASTTITNYRGLLPNTTTVLTANGDATRSWESIYDQYPHLEFVLYDDNGDFVWPNTFFWTGADLIAGGGEHDSNQDCNGFTNSTGYYGHVNEISFSNHQTVSCSTPNRVVCAITHITPTPSAIIATSASVSPVATASPTPTPSQQVCGRL
jgi:hypothetical protein